MKTKVSGSISVFLALLLTCFFTFVFGITEIFHYQCFLERRKDVSYLSTVNVASEYDAFLWNSYGILAIDMGYETSYQGPELIEQRTQDFAKKIGTPDLKWNCINLFPLALEDNQITSYSLLYEANPADLWKQGIKQGKVSTLSQDVMSWDKWKEDNNSQQKISLDELVSNGKNALEEKPPQEDSTTKDDLGETTVVEDTWEKEYDDPFMVYEECKKKGLLGILMGENSIKESQWKGADYAKVSCKGAKEEDTTANKLWYIQYVLSSFSNYTSKEKGTGLNYEVEYVIGRNQEEKENLDVVLQKILSYRMIQNSISIANDAVKRREIKSLATHIACLVQNPIAIPIVEVSVTAIWSFVESVLDIRTMLSGKKVPLVKNSSEWTSNLCQLGVVANPKEKAKESETGVDYESYLKMLLFMQSKEELLNGSLGVIEQGVRGYRCDQEFKVAQYVTAWKQQFEYQGKGIFSNFVLDSEVTKLNYRFIWEEEFSYQR